MKTRRIDRRTFLKGTGVAMALPFLESMGPMTRQAVGAAAKTSAVGSPMRFGLYRQSDGPHAGQFLP